MEEMQLDTCEVVSFDLCVYNLCFCRKAETAYSMTAAIQFGMLNKTSNIPVSLVFSLTKSSKNYGLSCNFGYICIFKECLCFVLFIKEQLKFKVVLNISGKILRTNLWVFSARTIYASRHIIDVYSTTYWPEYENSPLCVLERAHISKTLMRLTRNAS